MTLMTFQRLTDALRPDVAGLDRPRLYWLLDGARDPDVIQLLLDGDMAYTCLYEGRLSQRLRAAAPYLVHLAAGSPATERLLRLGWGRSWGVLTAAGTDLTLQQQKLHLKKLLRVRTEAGTVLAFRFFDPRVLNVYMPSCAPVEWQTVLGPLTVLAAETENGAGLNVFARSGVAIYRSLSPSAA